MKIQVVSDIHLEFGPITIENAGDTDVLILSGDICVVNDLAERDVYNLRGEHDKSNRFHTFFQECCANFPHVIYVMGNHEHYHGDYSTSAGTIRDRLGYLVNLHFLDKESVLIKDVLFVGGTLWTDMNKEDPNTLYAIKGYMNDYRIIADSSEVVNYKAYIGDTDKFEFKTRPAKFSPEKSVEDHKAMLAFIDNEIKRVGPWTKVVVVGHHAPSKASTKPQYEKDVIVNGAYSSDLSEFILDRPQIKLWTHGHTHHEFDYMIGSTRIFCNPRGYHMYEHQADVFDCKKVVEV
jgi:predicted phosphodiesterase